MDEKSKQVLQICGIEFKELNDLNGLSVPREQLLSNSKYEEIKKLIPELKTKYSSSFMTSLQKNAEQAQKWPLLNIIRQILNFYNCKMSPIRKCDGYTIDGKKKYKRFFILQITPTTNNTDINNTHTNTDNNLL